jgi:hypothetical protein
VTTEPATGAERPRRPRSRAALATIWASAALFLALLAVMAARVSAGQDPALRARAAATPPPTRRILIRRVIEKRVIVHLPPSAPTPATSSSQQLSSLGATTFPVPVTRTS